MRSFSRRKSKYVLYATTLVWPLILIGNPFYLGYQIQEPCDPCRKQTLNDSELFITIESYHYLVGFLVQPITSPFTHPPPEPCHDFLLVGDLHLPLSCSKIQHPLPYSPPGTQTEFGIHLPYWIVRFHA